MPGPIFRSQLRRTGWVPLATALVTALFVVLAGGFAAASWPLTQSVTLVNWLDQIYSIVAGIVVAVVATGDRLVEVHESTPTSFRRVVILRAAIAIAGCVVGAVVMYVPLHLWGVWPRDSGWANVLVPVGAVIFLGAIALATAAFSGTISATTIAVVAAWIILAMFWDPYVLPLYLQRGVPLTVAAGLFVLASVRLADSERNLAVAVTA